MKQLLTLFVVLQIALGFGCTNEHLISDKDYLSLVEKSFEERKNLANNRKTELFGVFNQQLSLNQKEALEFLYAFMPLSDLADYDGNFFLSNIDIALRTRKETKWGKDVPEEIFLHYVLPCRINNENLDSFRIVYYDEIFERVRQKEITEAALEINRWCHEKVSYMPADSRTSAPMSTILSARGRCGEESTFTVAALRTAGIPARQVYTPRWAHSDDNHAWVEIWIDGDWYYMGACEPEPVLDRGWFTEPARRAMLVHTKSFGAATGNENSIINHKYFTEVNNLSKYTVTKQIFVKVLDKNGLPLNNAIVEYQLYNYAEFFPIAIVPTTEDGISRLETGLGDLLIWAHFNDDFNYMKISVAETDTLVLILNRRAEGNAGFDLDFDVPIIRSPLAGPSALLIEKNAERINDGNIIRQKYIDSWMKPAEAKKLAVKLGIDTIKAVEIFARSMGNYNEIRYFLINTPDSLKQVAISLLEILPDKDLRDIKGLILLDHLIYSSRYQNIEYEHKNVMFNNYILNPRIANEIIISWRSYFRNILPSQFVQDAQSDPSIIIKYLDKEIKIAADENYYKTPLTPKGVVDLKVSDEASRAICFVALCRTLGIPARLEPGRNIPQYFHNSVWNDVYFADQKHSESNKGYLKIFSNETKPVPEYYIHFTIARFENGRYNTLEYDYNKKVSDFKEELSLPPGNYMLVTGNRLNDSKILSSVLFFDLSENEHKSIEVNPRKDLSENKIYGNVDLNKIVSLFEGENIDRDKIIENGVVILWIEPDMEPTKHIFNDLPYLKDELDDWGGFFLFLKVTSSDVSKFDPKSLKGLPHNTLFSTDSNLDAFKDLVKIVPAPDMRIPIVLLADKNGRVLFTSTGYRIGIGEQILKHLY